jgi:hypothetical protein
MENTMRGRSLVEIVKVHHDGKHHQNLSVRIERNYRETWCSKCGKAVMWERVTPMIICVHHNDETGEQLWSVCDENFFENWINSYKTLKEAFDMVEYNEHKTPKVLCSIRDCKETHSLTNGATDNPKCELQ